MSEASARGKGAKCGIHNNQRRLGLWATWQELRRGIWSCGRSGLQCWILDHNTQGTDSSAHCLKLLLSFLLFEFPHSQ